MNNERILMVLQSPHTSEKTTFLAEKYKQITFEVLSSATKLEIKSAVEKLFKVKVKLVNTLNVKGKTKKFKNLKGKRDNWKKAIVSLQEGYDIDFTAVE